MNATDDALTDDRLLGGRLRLLQPRHGYRAAIDPVLLAAATPARAGDAVLDLGAGSGAAMLCLAARVAGMVAVGLELQPEMVDLARRNVALNTMTDRVRVEAGNLLAPPPTLRPESFDHVTTNPPYGTNGTAPPDPARSIAHRETIPLAVWLRCAVRMVRHKGFLTLIQRADRLDEILSCLKEFCGGIEIIPLWPRAGVAARRVVVRARKGVRTPLKLQPGLILHDEVGRYTPEAVAILRDAAPLFL
ncbi:MAG: methyltransferase [Alphaproteobacteria bacterium]|nr:methyltransferase [Alphaproteobacteria bacterium]